MVVRINAVYPVILFKTQNEWEQWLSRHHKTNGVWLKFAKKKSGETSVTYDEALDIALCYGWIDSQAKSLDETFYLQKFTPRGPKSIWSKINTEHIARLVREGRMRLAGLAAVEAAKKDGRWDAAYHSPKDMKVSETFLKLLKANKKAYNFYNTLSKANTFAIAWRIQTAKKEETKVRRMQQILKMLENGEKLH
ncbi:MAG: YdeI/OmpD-associated family protein [Candidatus Levybacteria bacterium]|nr:YdeI/OmpD-associated family protein [Candidatus Levybacteria bacterium]